MTPLLVAVCILTGLGLSVARQIGTTSILSLVMSRKDGLHTRTCALLLAIMLASPGCIADEDMSPHEASELLYNQAVKMRDQEGAGQAEMRKAVMLLGAAAGIQLGESDPQHLASVLAQMLANDGSIKTSLHGNSTVQSSAMRELAKAFQLGRGVEQHQQLALQLLRAASQMGDAEAQGLMGMRYAYGLHNAASVGVSSVLSFEGADEAQALVHYYFAAANGDPFSRMALGYRHQHGLGVPKSCWTAVAYYQPVAEQVVDIAGTPGSLPQIERIRLNVHANQGLKADRHREVLQYYQYSADHGNVDAQTAVGQVLNYGTHGVQRDHATAKHYFQQAAAADDADAMAHLGHMHANGLGAPQDYQAARKLFERAAARNSASGMFGLACLHLNGFGVEVDYVRAFKLFSQAMEQGLPDAYYYLGVMHMKGLGVKRKSAQRAFSYFNIAAHAGNLQAMYNTAMMQLGGKGTQRLCKPALALLKEVAEKGRAAVVLQQAHEQFFKGHNTRALLLYLQAAEMGLELGQSNAAWMMERGYGHAGPNAASVAYSLYRRSAEQGNVASLLLMGDSYFYGQGVPQDWVRAAAIYYEAYQERNAEAMFNLGFMHEFGAGVPKDLQLARKFYMMTSHTMPDARYAVQVALCWLRLHEVWERLLPLLPRHLDFVWGQVFVLQQPYTSPLGVMALLLRNLMPKQLSLYWESFTWRVADALGMLLPDFDELSELASSDEVGETATLVGLVVLLFIVLRLRRRRAEQGAGPGGPGQQQQQQGVGDGAGVAAAGEQQQRQEGQGAGAQQQEEQQPGPEQ